MFLLYTISRKFARGIKKRVLEKRLAAGAVLLYIADRKEACSLAFGGFFIMDKYVCSVCGYVYDPAVGDPDGGIPPGTAFEDIPDTWVCPVCGVGKDSFTKE